MPYSLRTKLKHLACERDITVKECERLIKALDLLDAFEEMNIQKIRDIFDKHISEKEQE